MKQALKAFYENTYEIEEKLKNKVNLLQTPVVLLNDNEIEEIKTLFTHLSQKIGKLSKHFEFKTSGNLEHFTVYEQILKNYNETRHKLELKIEEYLKNREEKFFQEQGKQTRKQLRNPVHVGIMSDNTSEISDYAEKDHLEISRVFLNTIITSNQVTKLQSLKKLSEEKEFVSEIFNLDINSQKEQILIDYYLNAYKFSLRNKFTIEKISTFLSILYFLFNYSILNKKIVREKSNNVFLEILDFHAVHRPPYCFEIFTGADKEIIIDYLKKTFFRNYTVYENIFKYNINIYLLSKDFKSIPALETPGDLALCEAQEIQDIKGFEIIKNNYIDRQLKVENAETKVKKKTEYEKLEENTLEKLKTFISTFYKSKALQENDKMMQEHTRQQMEAEAEAEETQKFLENKIPEIMKEVNERIKIADVRALREYEEMLSAHLEQKDKKK